MSAKVYPIAIGETARAMAAMVAAPTPEQRIRHHQLGIWRPPVPIPRPEIGPPTSSTRPIGTIHLRVNGCRIAIEAWLDPHPADAVRSEDLSAWFTARVV